jgi:hypothetical protein
MSDLIDRQAAIDALDTGLWGVEWDKALATAMLEDLPSAQPEIIRCKDCEYGDQDEVGRWFCTSLGCQIGDDDGSGFCADAERRTE